MKLPTLLVALFLALGWAIRGHFGHEWGAAWAGGIAGLAVVVASKRQDWLQRLPTLAALAAIGWAVGGMMSYGVIVGYGRGTDFGNVLYGLTMLGVVGGLYGFIGGGMFGLGVENKKLQQFHDDIQSGKYLILIYSKKGSGETIEAMMREKHPDSEYVATDEHYISPFSDVSRTNRPVS